MDYALLRDMVLLFGLALVTVILFRQFKLPSIIGFCVLASWPALCPGVYQGYPPG